MRNILSFDYAPHEGLVETAKIKPELWRLVIGIFLAVAIWIFLSNLLANLVVSWLSPDQSDAFWDASRTGETPGTMIFLLVQIGLLVPATGITAALLHGRELMSMIGHLPTAVGQFALVFAAQVGLIIVLTLLPPYTYGDKGLQSGLVFGRWLMLLPIAVLAVLLQSAAEEVAFRGYIQQQLAARFQHPAIWIVVPSAIFAFGHYDAEGAGQNALTIALLAGLFGCLLADITARAGTLGPAIAIHASNNLLAMLFVGTPDSLSGLALYTTPFGLGDAEVVRAWLPAEAVSMIASWLLARLVIRR